MELLSSARPSAVFRRPLIAMVATIWLVIAGCGTSDNSEKVAGKDGDSSAIISGAEEGKRLLEAMLAAYRTAPGYQDRGQLTLTRRGANGGEDKIADAVEFARPNKLRLSSVDALIVSDGKQIRAKAIAPHNNDYDGQIVEIDAAKTWTVDLLAELDARVFVETPRFSPTSLPARLLFDDRTLAEDIAKSKRVAVLPSQTVDGHECRGVQIENESGRAVWWIDAKSSIVRRYEFPVEKAAKESGLAPNELTLVGDYLDASFAPPTAERFVFDVPAGAKLVRRLVPPPPVLPAELLGRPCPDFRFRLLDGGEITRKDLAGKVAFVMFWTIRDPAMQQALVDIEKKMAKVVDAEKDATFLAVLTDPVNVVSDANVKEGLAQLKVNLKVARVVDQDPIKTFRLAGQPTTLFLSRDGVVQDFFIGFGPAQFEQTKEVLKSLLADKALHVRALGQIADYQRQYEEQLVLAKRDPVAIAAPAAKSEPQHARVKSLWKNAKLKAPGNVYAAVGENASGGVFVVDDLRRVVELGPDGSVTATHDLKLQRGAVVSFVRSATMPDGRPIYVAAMAAQPKFYIYDAAWRQVTQYPLEAVGENEDNPAIADVRIADLDGDGEVEIVAGYGGVHGVHIVRTNGNRRRSVRSVERLAGLAIAPSSANQPGLILAATQGGPVAVIDARGQEQGRWTADVGTLVFCTPSPNGLVALAMARDDAFSVVELSPQGKTLWRYDLPPGVYPAPIEPIAWGRVVGDADHWTVAAADGSIHLIDAQGKLVDRFNYGESLGGILPTSIAGHPALVVSSPTGVEAISFEKK